MAAAQQPAVMPDFDRTQPVALEADEVTYDNVTGLLIAAGNVVVYHGERTLTADRIIYDSKADRIAAEGEIVIRDPSGATFTAESADLDARLRDGLIRGARAMLGEQAKFAAVEARRVDDRYNVLGKAVFSPCEVCAAKPTPLWRIRARKIVHDELEKAVHYEDATFDVLGVPVAWLPYFRHPDPSVKRASGFLTPDFIRSSTYGYAIKQPYYWVIDDQSDATLTPFVTTDDGVILEGEYRRAFAGGAMTLAGSVGHGDYDGEDKLRGHVFSDGVWTIWGEAEAGFSVRQASDDAYLRRYDFSDEDRLTSEVFYRRTGAAGFADISLLRFQSLRKDEPIGQIPLVLPSYESRWLFDDNLFGGRFGLNAEGYALSRADGRDAGGFSLGVDWERQFQHDSGMLFRLFGAARADVWRVEDDPAFDNAAIARFSPHAGAEARFPFARRDVWATQIIEPIAQLVWAPDYDDEDEIPNEDSRIVEFDETNLFADNRFPGFDGFEEGLRANIGMRYQFLADNGVSASASFGRVLRAEAIDSFSGSAGLNLAQSDFVGAWTVRLPPYGKIANRLRFADDFTLNRNELYVIASFAGLDVEASYIFLDEDATAGAVSDRQEGALDIGYQLDRNWRLLGDMRRDLEADKWISTGATLTYSNECVDVDLYADRRFTSSEGAPSSLNFGVRVRLWALGGAAEPRPATGICAPVTSPRQGPRK